MACKKNPPRIYFLNRWMIPIKPRMQEMVQSEWKRVNTAIQLRRPFRLPESDPARNENLSNGCDRNRDAYLVVGSGRSESVQSASSGSDINSIQADGVPERVDQRRGHQKNLRHRRLLAEPFLSISSSNLPNSGISKSNLFSGLSNLNLSYSNFNLSNSKFQILKSFKFKYFKFKSFKV